LETFLITFQQKWSRRDWNSWRPNRWLFVIAFSLSSVHVVNTVYLRVLHHCLSFVAPFNKSTLFLCASETLLVIAYVTVLNLCQVVYPLGNHVSYQLHFDSNHEHNIYKCAHNYCTFTLKFQYINGVYPLEPLYVPQWVRVLPNENQWSMITCEKT